MAKLTRADVIEAIMREISRDLSPEQLRYFLMGHDAPASHFALGHAGATMLKDIAEQITDERIRFMNKHRLGPEAVIKLIQPGIEAARRELAALP